MSEHMSHLHYNLSGFKVRGGLRIYSLQGINCLLVGLGDKYVLNLLGLVQFTLIAFRLDPRTTQLFNLLSDIQTPKVVLNLLSLEACNLGHLEVDLSSALLLHCSPSLLSHLGYTVIYIEELLLIKRFENGDGFVVDLIVLVHQVLWRQLAKAPLADLLTLIGELVVSLVDAALGASE